MTVQLTNWIFNPTLVKFLVALAGLAIVYALSKAAQRGISRRIEDASTRYNARKFVALFGYFLAVVVVATVFSDRLAGLTVALGVAGAGVAFALQEVIVSVAGWMALSFGRYYSPGDRVQLGGIKGDVIDIGILRTTLMEVGQWVNADLYNGRIVRVANSFVFKEPVFNYSADFPFLWDEIILPVRFGSDWEYTRKMLQQVADEVCRGFAVQSLASWKDAVHKYRLEEARIEPVITLAATDNWIEFTTRYIVAYQERRVVRDRLFTRILEEVDKSGNRVRLASATFEIVNLPRVDIAFAEGKASAQPSYVP
ncbi:MAG: mechanosensitive ion channel [Acidobacteriota bacterium]|nr:mechanosensitive ion channel [Acidobacteriota bacterium]